MSLIPGEILTDEGEIELNADRPVLSLMVINTGDRPVQVGSHYHFAETNPALTFDREAARGFRLDITAGTAVRFEPGQGRQVSLVAFGGARKVYGFRGAVMGSLGQADGQASLPAQAQAQAPAQAQPPASAGGTAG